MQVDTVSYFKRHLLTFYDSYGFIHCINFKNRITSFFISQQHSDSLQLRVVAVVGLGCLLAAGSGTFPAVHRVVAKHFASSTALFPRHIRRPTLAVHIPAMADEETQVALVTDAAGAPQPDDSTAVVAAAPAGKKMVKKIIRKKKKPARVQIDPSLITSEPPPQTGTIFNIWYNKWSGGDHDGNAQTKAKGRCNIATDAGYTKADSMTGSFFCVSFARGVCAKGVDCDYLHRLPGVYDIFGPNVDCFGRDKFSDYRDDMGGVGSFMRVNRTVYIGRIHVTDDIEEIVARHFAEWGQVERSKYSRRSSRQQVGANQGMQSAY